MVQSGVQRPSHLGSTLGCALSFPQLFDVCHLRDRELAASQAQRHVVHHGSMVTVRRVGILEVHERDATSIGQDAFPFVLI